MESQAQAPKAGDVDNVDIQRVLARVLLDKALDDIRHPAYLASIPLTPREWAEWWIGLILHVPESDWKVCANAMIAYMQFFPAPGVNYAIKILHHEMSEIGLARALAALTQRAGVNPKLYPYSRDSNVGRVA